VRRVEWKLAEVTHKQEIHVCSDVCSFSKMSVQIVRTFELLRLKGFVAQKEKRAAKTLSIKAFAVPYLPSFSLIFQ